MTRALAIATILVTFAAGCSGSSGRRPSVPGPVTTLASTATTSSTGPACPGRPAPAAGETTERISVGGVDRTYELVVPSSVRADRPLPVVFEFHGFGSNAIQQVFYANFRPQAERDGFIIVAPDGQGAGGGRHFNLLGTPTEGDDVAFTLAILDHLAATFCVDTKRVYATGMSDGGGMTSVLACRASDRFAAFGPVALELHLPGCAATRPVPIAAFHGTADPIVPFAGGPVHCCGGAAVPSVAEEMSGWAAQDRCATTPTDSQLSPMVLRREWTGCAPGGAVVLYIIDGGGHTWPGAALPVRVLGPTTTEISASDVLWRFFQDHPMPSPQGQMP